MGQNVLMALTIIAADAVQVTLERIVKWKLMSARINPVLMEESASTSLPDTNVTAQEATMVLDANLMSMNVGTNLVVMGEHVKMVLMNTSVNANRVMKADNARGKWTNANPILVNMEEHAIDISILILVPAPKDLLDVIVRKM